MKTLLLAFLTATLVSTAVINGSNALMKRPNREVILEPTSNCMCIMYYQCNANFTLNRYGDNIIDIRRRDGPCPHYLDVCCKKEDTVPHGGTSNPPPYTSSEPPPYISSEPPPHISSEPPPYISSKPPSYISSESPPYTSEAPPYTPHEPPPYVPSPSPPSYETSSHSSTDFSSPDHRPRPTTQDRYKSRGCGFRNLDGVGFRIIGGKTEAQFGEFPWVVALLGPNDEYICGGSLIHTKVVLTSAHCTRSKFIPNLVVRAGEWDRGTTKEVLPHQDRLVSDVIEHEHYHGGALLNDIALIILKEPMILADNVDLLCLPPQDYNFDHTQCLASGWGKESFNLSANNQVILKKVDLPVVPKDTCESVLRQTRLGPHFELHDSFICAGGKKGHDTCNGDGGSPLICPLQDNPERYQQAGIVAWGIGCGDVIPGVYASVARFREWIDRQLGERDIFISNA